MFGLSPFNFFSRLGRSVSDSLTLISVTVRGSLDDVVHPVNVTDHGILTVLGEAWSGWLRGVPTPDPLHQSVAEEKGARIVRTHFGFLEIWRYGPSSFMDVSPLSFYSIVYRRQIGEWFVRHYDGRSYPCRQW